MLFAFGLNDLKELHDQHFGESKYFAIYKIDKDITLVNELSNNNHTHEHQHGESKKALKIANVLGEVDILVAKAFGTNINKMKNKYKILLINGTTRLQDTINYILQHIEEIKTLFNSKNIVNISIKKAR